MIHNEEAAADEWSFINWRGGFAVQALAVLTVGFLFSLHRNEDLDVMQSERLVYGYHIN